MTTLILVLLAGIVGWLARENRELGGRLARAECAIGQLCDTVYAGPVSMGGYPEEEGEYPEEPDPEPEFMSYDPADPTAGKKPN